MVSVILVLFSIASSGLYKKTHLSEFSDSVSLSSFLCDFHFLYLSIKSIRYEFFFAFLMNGNFNNSFAVGRYKRKFKSHCHYNYSVP